MSDPGDAYDRHVGRYGAQLAAVVGAEQVAAVDPSEDFVAACRARVPGADVRVGAGEDLPFTDDAFDAVLAQLVVQLMEDRDAGVHEMARVTRPGGVVAAVVWDSRTTPMLRAFWDAALAVAPDEAGAIDDGRRVGYSSAEDLGELWAACGLVAVATGELHVHADYHGFDDLFEPFTTGTGHSGACYAGLDAARRARLRQDAHRRLGAPAGPFRLTARAWTVRGQAP